MQYFTASITLLCFAVILKLAFVSSDKPNLKRVTRNLLAVGRIDFRPGKRMDSTGKLCHIIFDNRV